MKKTIRELTDYKGLLEKMLKTIRHSPQDKVLELVELIKNNGSLQDIAQAVGSPTKFPRVHLDSPGASGHRRGSEDVESSLYEPSSSMPQPTAESSRLSTSSEEEPHVELPRAALHPYARVTLESLCDIPLFKVPAKPWTEVTDANDLVSHLVSLYFTWDHPCAQFVDQCIFLDHMKRGDLSSSFCSPLLVNSLLSLASVWSPLPVHSVIFWVSDRSTRRILIVPTSSLIRRTHFPGDRASSRKRNDC